MLPAAIQSEHLIYFMSREFCVLSQEENPKVLVSIETCQIAVRFSIIKIQEIRYMNYHTIQCVVATVADLSESKDTWSVLVKVGY